MINNITKRPASYDTGLFLWSLLGSNQGPTDYESVALTNCAKGPD